MLTKWQQAVKRSSAIKSAKIPWRKPDFEKISPEKLITSVGRGLKVLLPRIEALRRELEPLQTAYIRLTGKKHEAQLLLTDVKFIPTGISSRRSNYVSPKSPQQTVDEMTSRERKALREALDALEK